jgi:hypothetical protein
LQYRIRRLPPITTAIRQPDLRSKIGRRRRHSSPSPRAIGTAPLFWTAKGPPLAYRAISHNMNCPGPLDERTTALSRCSRRVTPTRLVKGRAGARRAARQTRTSPNRIRHWFHGMARRAEQIELNRGGSCADVCTYNVLRSHRVDLSGLPPALLLKPDAWPVWLREEQADEPQLKALLAPAPPTT